MFAPYVTDPRPPHKCHGTPVCIQSLAVRRTAATPSTTPYRCIDIDRLECAGTVKNVCREYFRSVELFVATLHTRNPAVNDLISYVSTTLHCVDKSHTSVLLCEKNKFHLDKAAITTCPAPFE